MILLLNVKIPIGVVEIVVVVSAYKLNFWGVIPTNDDVTRQEKLVRKILHIINIKRGNQIPCCGIVADFSVRCPYHNFN